MSGQSNGIPLEEFINSLTSQLDRSQATLALKANAKIPLTFAVKEFTLDLRAFLEIVGSVVYIRPAEAGERDASTVHLNLTTITKPMIEENTRQFQADEPLLKEVLGEDLDEDEQRRLEWAGVHTIGQFRELYERSGEQAIERVAQIPALKLRQALDRASRPRISRLVRGSTRPDNRSSLRIRGINLMKEGLPNVRINDDPVKVLEASDSEVVVLPLEHQNEGVLVIEPIPGQCAECNLNITSESEI